MPGISGIISARPSQEGPELVTAMTDCMKQEGPYVSRTHFAPEMGVHAGCVAHEGSVGGSQVLFNEEMDIALILCGECFFSSRISIELKAKGHNIGTSKNDWLIHLYEEQRDRFFEKLNGTFSGLLIDKRLGKVFLFNDRYGVERIYWHQNNGSIFFASEAKALLRIFPELRAFDDEGVAQFLAFGCALGSRTLFKGIQTLPGGSLWRFEDGKCHKTTYFSSDVWEKQAPLSVKDFETEFQKTFMRAVPRYFESDSRIGISLTAGLDTRMLMACRPETSANVVTYTFDGPTGKTADSQLARQVAQAAGLDHHVLRLGLDFFSDFESHVDRTVRITDGCFGVTGAHEVYLNRLARQLAPIRLTGNYGGEILREVSTFKPLNLSPGLLNPDIGVMSNSFTKILDKREPVTFAAFGEIPWKLFGSLRAGQSQVTTRFPYLDNELVALAYRRPTELLRSPEPAMRLIRSTNAHLAKTPTDMGLLGQSPRLEGMVRRALAKVACKLDYFSSEGLPPRLAFLDPVISSLGSALHIVGTHKYLRYRNWFRHQLADYVNDAVADARLRQSPFWNPKFIRHMVKDHIAGRKNYVHEINAVITLAAAERLLFHGQPPLPDVKEHVGQGCGQMSAVVI